jgi:hypothetical protein
MFTRPTNEQILRTIADELHATVLPDLQSESVRVLVSQMEQLVRSCAERAAHEIAWVHDEAADIAAATGEPVGAPLSLHLDDVVAWYDVASRVLSAALEAAFAADDAVRVAQLKQLIDARSETQMRIVGALDLVGRG